MHSFEARLADWHRLYIKLEEARSLLSAARSNSPTASAIGKLEVQVARLQQRSDQALEAIQFEINRIRTRNRPGTPSDAPDQSGILQPACARDERVHQGRDEIAGRPTATLNHSPGRDTE
jgi:hypothetical protein